MLATEITWHTNVGGALRVFRAVAEAGVPALVYASSVGAYSPGPRTRGGRDQPVDEDGPTDGWPTASYLREKAHLERSLDAFECAHPELRVVRLRPRTVRIPVWPVREALWLAWQMHLVPASPYLFDGLMRLPLMDTSRARTELGWSPRYSAREAIEEFLSGRREGAGMPTAPLAPTTPSVGPTGFTVPVPVQQLLQGLSQMPHGDGAAR